MKTSTFVLLGIGVIALMHFTNLGVAVNVLQYYIQSVDFTGVTTGRVVLMIQNPSNADIQVNSMAGTITVNGTTLGNISNFQGGVLIPANGQQPVNVNVALSLSGIVSNLFTILTQPTGDNQLDFIISGNANINGGVILPFNITQTINV